MAETTIEWTKNADGSAGKSWNPIRARRIIGGKVGWYCQKKSPGCKNCFAERMNLRVNDQGEGIGNGVSYTVGSRDAIEPYLDEHVLLEPLHWRKPTTIFVESMSDLFGSWVADEWIDKVCAVEALCPQHTFIHVTKRPERRLKYMAFPDFYFKDEYGREVVYDGHKGPGTIWVNGSCRPWPLSNVRELVTVCNQEEADKHIPILLQTPAACRGVSIEPMLGPIDIACYIGKVIDEPAWLGTLDWVICGGESGPGARPMHPDWARSLRDQCQVAGVPFFFKQWGEWKPISEMPESEHSRYYVPNVKAEDPLDQSAADDVYGKHCTVETRAIGFDGDEHWELREGHCSYLTFRVGKKRAGRLLDGREWSQVPEVRR